MSAELNKARSQLNSIKSLLKQEKIQAAIIAMDQAIRIYLRIQLLKHEKQDSQKNGKRPARFPKKH